MKLFFEILNGSSSFEIEVDHTDTLSEIKKKIEKSQHIPFDKQTLIVDGAYILRNDLNLEQCKIRQESHLQIEVSAEDKPNYSDDQITKIEESPALEVSAGEYFKEIEWPLTPEEITKISSYQGTIKVQDSMADGGGGQKQ